MTIVRKYPGVFSKNIGNINFIPPVTSGLLGTFLFGKDKASSERNHAPGGVDGVMTGSAAYETSAVVLGPDVYLQTQIVETKSFTFATVAQVPPAGHAFIGNLGGSGYNGPYATSELNNSTHKFGPRAKTTPTGNHIAIEQELTDVNRWMMFIAAWDETAQTAIAYIPSLESAGGPNPLTVTGQSPRDTSTAQLRIGRMISTSSVYAASTRHALDYIYDRCLSIAEMQTIYEHAKQWFYPRGIAI
jgi:hypothetical protein